MTTWSHVGVLLYGKRKYFKRLHVLVIAAAISFDAVKDLRKSRFDLFQ